MPILGIVASQLTLANPAWESIESYTVGSGGSSSITFGSGGTIPQTYKHLQIRSLSKATAGGLQYATVQFNGDSASNYSLHILYGDGSGSPGGTGSASTSRMYDGIIDSTQFGGAVLDILDYTNNSKYKATRSLSGYDANGSGSLYFMSGNWRSTSAITSITIATSSANNFAQYSSFALYGIKG